MRFSVLGPLEVVDDDRPVTLGGLTQRAFLAFLLLNANRTVSVSQAVAALWGQSPPASAKNMLHNAVWGLRKTLKDGDEVSLLSQKPGYVLIVPADRIDLHVFRDLVSGGRDVASSGDHDAAAGVFRRALSLWRGHALADLVDTGIGWPVLATLEEARLAAWEDCFESELACGRHNEVIGELTGLVEANPLRERLCGQLMLALYRSGRQAEALGVFRRARSAFVTELGIEPGLELQQLERAVLEQDPALAVAAPPERSPATPVVTESVTAGQRERRRVSVVLVEFQPAQGIDAEIRDHRLSAVLGILSEEAARFGGMPATGGGALAHVVFGATNTGEDDTVRAVRAAMALRDRLRHAPGETRIAVSTGDALVDRGDLNGPVMPSVLEDGQALLTAVSAQEVLVCDATYRASRNRIEYAPSSGGGWRPVSAEAAPSSGELLPLVERERETGLLERLLLDTVQIGRPHLVTLLGEAGHGKTRLVAELVRIADERRVPARVLVGRIPGEGDGTAYRAVSAIVKNCAGIQDTDPLATADEKLATMVRGVVRDPEQEDWVRDNLRVLAGLDRARLGSRPASETWRAARMFLAEAASAGPLVMVLEDLHNADDVILEFVDELTDQLAPVPLLVIVTARPELLRRRPGWAGGKRDATTISLNALSGAGTAQLLRTLFDRYGLSEKDVVCSGERGPAFWQNLVERIGGVPLFAEEYVRMLAESRPGDGLALPESVQTVISARLDKVPDQERAILLDASVLGMVVWPGAVAALSCRDIDDVRRGLDFLTRREILHRAHRSTVAGEPEYTFGHVLIRDIAYNRLPLDVRAARHRLAAAWIESLPVDHAEALAHHYGTAVELAAALGSPTAELTARARVVLSETGRRAAALGARQAAIRCYRAALDLCPANDPARPDLLLRYGTILAEMDGRGEEVLIEARDALLVAGEAAGAASAEFHLALLADRRAGDAGSRAGRDRALSLLRPTDSSEAAVELRCGLALSLVIDGRCAEALDLARHALVAAERLSRPELVVSALKAHGAARVDLGDLDGVADFERAVDLCARHGLATTRMLGNLSCALARAGELDRLEDIRAQATRAVARYGDALATRMLRGTEVNEQYWAGNSEVARELADRLLNEYGVDWLPLRASWHIVRGRNALSQGAVAEAETEAAQGLDAARLLGDPQDVFPALAFAARAALSAGREDDARALTDELLRGLSGRSIFPDVGVDLPVVLSALGYPETALDGIRPSPWLAAARAYLAGDHERAAELYQRIGSKPDEEQARHSQRRLQVGGRGSGG